MIPNPFKPTDEESDPAWTIVEQELDLEKTSLNETLFALGNGYLGMRGTFEEGTRGTPFAPTEGTFINGFYESAPIVYGEKFQWICREQADHPEPGQRQNHPPDHRR